MIHVFESDSNDASVVYDGSTLTPEERNKGISLEALPEKETVAGKVVVLKCRRATGEVWWEYVDEPINDELEQLKEVVADLTELVLFGGGA